LPAVTAVEPASGICAPRHVAGYDLRFLLVALAPLFTLPFSAVDCRRERHRLPEVRRLPLVLTLVVELAELMLKLFVCKLLELL